MGSLLSSIRDEHRAFECWCEKMNYECPQREYWEHPKFKEYEDYLDPPEERSKRKQAHIDRKNKEKNKVGVLDLDLWYNADVCKKVKCKKCDVFMLYKWGWILTDEYGCPKCGHTEGGEY